MPDRSDGGEAILAAFRNSHVDYVISSPGSEWAPVWEALARQKSSNRPGPVYIDCGHEILAVDMALGYTQMTGRLQAVLLHAGMGLLQGSMAIHGAAVTEVPMLIMSGESQSYGEDPQHEPGAQWYRTLGIVGGPGRLIDSIVKSSNHVTSPYTLYQSVVRSAEIAQRVPRGPTYLSVGLEAMLHEWTPPAKFMEIPPVPKTQAQPQDVDAVASLLLQARNPVIITESAGGDPAAFAALVNLAGLLAIPVAESSLGVHANFPRDNPLYMGTGIAPILKDADLVLAVSCRVPWYPPSKVFTDAKIVIIGENPLKTHMVYQNLQADIYLEGDLASSLQLLATAISNSPQDSELVQTRRSRWHAEHDKLQRRLQREEENASRDAPIDPLFLCSMIRRVMPDDAIYVDETCSYNTMLYEHLQWSRPQSFLRVPTGLGHGFGVALGAKLAARDRPVVLLTGDGSFLYNPVLPALSLAKSNDLPLLVIVFNNAEYRVMKRGHLRLYPEGVAARTNLFHGVTIEGPDYSEVAKLHGGYGQRVTDPGEIMASLSQALHAVRNGETAIINVVLR